MLNCSAVHSECNEGDQVFLLFAKVKSTMVIEWPSQTTSLHWFGSICFLAFLFHPVALAFTKCVGKPLFIFQNWEFHRLIVLWNEPMTHLSNFFLRSKGKSYDTQTTMELNNLLIKFQFIQKAQLWVDKMLDVTALHFLFRDYDSQ